MESIQLPSDSSHLKAHQEDSLTMVLVHTTGAAKALPQPISDNFTPPHSRFVPLLLFTISLLELPF